MKLSILTPEKEIFNGEVRSVKVPGLSGQFEILKDHAAIVSSLKDGQVRILNEKGVKTIYQIEKGFVEVINNEIAILVNGQVELLTDK